MKEFTSTTTTISQFILKSIGTRLTLNRSNNLYLDGIAAANLSSFISIEETNEMGVLLEYSKGMADKKGFDASIKACITTILRQKAEKLGRYYLL